MVCVLPGVARAQVGLSLAAVSDYRYRGVSLSDDRPAASLSITLDHRSGLYAGGKLIVADIKHEGVEVVGYMDYAGFAARPQPKLSVDLGVINYNLTSYRFRKRTVDYTELYAGFVTDHFNAHLYYAPDYYQSGVRTLYTDLGGGFRPAPRMKLFGHVGVLAPIGGRIGPGTRKVRYDFRAGGSVALGQAELSLTWTHLTPPYLPHSLGGQHADRLAVGLAYFF
jgi:uncharacterized protein (TIGR02001 family)